MRQAVILVGGRGTRLGVLAQHTPKPLIPIAGDKRFLDYLLEQFARHSIGEILLLAGHFGEQVEARYQGARVLGAQVSVIREPQPAGTAGALRYASDRLDSVFLMTNGDSLIDFNLLELPLTLAPEDVGALAK
jgi:D-glycero-D-manno-heptose 1,7-bisphosphate phosphatase